MSPRSLHQLKIILRHFSAARLYITMSPSPSLSTPSQLYSDDGIFRQATKRRHAALPKPSLPNPPPFPSLPALVIDDCPRVPSLHEGRRERPIRLSFRPHHASSSDVLVEEGGRMMLRDAIGMPPSGGVTAAPATPRRSSNKNNSPALPATAAVEWLDVVDSSPLLDLRHCRTTTSRLQPRRCRPRGLF